MEAERSELSLCLNLAKAGRRFSRIMLVVCKYIYRVHIYIYMYRHLSVNNLRHWKIHTLHVNRGWRCDETTRLEILKATHNRTCCVTRMGFISIYTHKEEYLIEL